MLQRRVYATFCFIWRRTKQYRQEALCGVILEWRKRRKKRLSRICDFLFSMNTCKAVQKIDKMWRHTLKKGKKIIMKKKGSL